MDWVAVALDLAVLGGVLSIVGIGLYNLIKGA